MHRSFIVAAAAALTGHAVAQTAEFANATWAPVTVGTLWPIHWTAGNGHPVTLSLSNATWSYNIFELRAATPGHFDWLITVPEGFVEGLYQLALVQVGGGTSTSPIFGVSFNILPPGSTTSSASVSPTLETTLTTLATSNATVTVSPTITVVCPVIWYDEDCGCTKTTTSPVVMPTPTNTEWVWHDKSCDCSKTAIVPSATWAPTYSDVPSNYTAPLTTPQPPAGNPISPTATGPAGWMGAASKFQLSSSMVVAIAFAGAAFAL